MVWGIVCEYVGIFYYDLQYNCSCLEFESSNFIEYTVFVEDGGKVCKREDDFKVNHLFQSN